MRGTKKLKELAKEQRREPTRAEALFWAAVRRKEFDGYKFYRQRIVWKYIADYYCPKLRLVVEIDGPIHERVENVEYDRVRDEVFRGMGLTVLRFGNERILSNLAACLEEIREVMRIRNEAGKAP
jgi:very-short-patch-repair endonuclease